MEALKCGIYLTEYGNEAYVSGRKSKTAWDLDMQERIPMAVVTDRWVRKAEPQDKPTREWERWLR